MAAKMILCNLFQPTAKVPSWTASRNCEYSDKDTIPRWLAPLRKHCRLCPTGRPSQNRQRQCIGPALDPRVGLSASGPSRCFNLILRLLYFLCQCDEGVGAAQSRWFNPLMENHLREARRQILQATAQERKNKTKTSHLPSVNSPYVEAVQGRQSF